MKTAFPSLCTFLSLVPSFLSCFPFPSFFSLTNITSYHRSDWIIYAKSLICWFLLNPFLSCSQTNEGKWHNYKDNREFPLRNKEIQSGRFRFCDRPKEAELPCFPPRGFATGGNCCWGDTDGSRDISVWEELVRTGPDCRERAKSKTCLNTLLHLSFYTFPFLGNFCLRPVWPPS